MDTSRIGGRFELEASVGRGAFAEVFRARDLRTGELVALKRMHPTLATDVIARERFLREARLLSRVESPHVVPLIAHGDDTDSAANEPNALPWMALAWLEGDDLSRVMSKGRIVPAQAVAIARQAALGLDALHRAGIVHRDVKPANFFVRFRSLTDLHVTLIDLGVARAPVERDITLDNVRVGTPAYMSPEQARGDDRLSPRSDLYSLGAVLYELLAGRKPFVGTDPFSILARIVLEDPQPLATFAPELPEELLEIVRRAMERDPSHRFESALAMAEALASPGVLPDRPSLFGADNEVPTAQLRVAQTEKTIERRVVTVLLADVGAVRDGEAACRTVERVIAQHGGNAHRLLGRRVLALFGAQRTAGDEPVRAARAALALQHELPPARVALGTARALAGAGAPPMEAVERCAKDLERAGGAIAVDEDTARALRAHFVVEGAERSWVLRGERASYTAVSSKLLGREVPMMGRERELDSLLDAARNAQRAKSNAAALVTGAPGMGKSRLRVEFLRHLEAEHPFAQLAIRCDPMLQDVPFGALGRAVRHRAMIEPDDHPQVRAAALSRWVRSLGAKLDFDVLRVLAAVDDVPDALGDDADARRDRLREGVSQLLGALAKSVEKTLVVIVEDIQWLDDASVDALGWSLEGTGEHWLFLLALGRPEVFRRWPRLWDATMAARIELAPLTERATEQLVWAALGPEAQPSRVRAIVERSTGNPLFAEELVRSALADDGELPLAIQAAFQGRLDALPPEAKRAALVASVLGTTVWPDAVSAMDPTLSTDAALAALVHQELLSKRQRARLGRREEFLFRHALLRETAYAMLSPEDAARCHAAAARWLAAAGERDDAILGEHFFRAGDGQRAAERFLDAARRALREGANVAALAHTERGVSGASIDKETLAQLHSLAAAAAHRLGRYDTSLEHSARGLALDASRAIELQLTGQRALTLRRTGRVRDAVELMHAALSRRTEAEDRAPEQPPATYAARIYVELEGAWADVQRMEFARAEERAAAVLEKIPATADKGLLLAARHALAQALHGEEKLESALREHRAVIDGAEAEGYRWRAIGARVGLGQVLLALGLTEAALRELDTAVEQARNAGLPSSEGYAQHQRGRALARLWRAQEAEDAQRRAAEIAANLGNPALEASALAARATIAAHEGRADEARAFCERALGFSAIPRGWAATALAVNAWLSARARDVAAARSALEEALSRVDEGGEDEGDESALSIVFLACARINEGVLAERARRAAKRRFDHRADMVSDPALRASVRSLARSITEQR
ncbi:MAG: protein kinase [Myxococcales bacterium]|nr:protein kinase [Myxococcales bacterium]